jgi:hypothetical protein
MTRYDSGRYRLQWNDETLGNLKEINDLHSRRPIARLAAVLFQHAHIGHHHAAVDRLAHVVNGQQAHLHARERFHLDARLAHRLDLHAAMHAGRRFIRLEIDGDARQRQWMTQGNQVAGPFRRHDRSDAGNAQHVAFFRGAGDDQLQGLGLHADGAGGHGNAVGVVLGGDVDHVGLAGGVEVRQVVGGRAGGRDGHR